MTDKDAANPYQAPQAPVDTGAAHHEIRLASGWRRLGTYLIDVICFYMIFTVMLIGLVLILGENSLTILDDMSANLIGLGFFMIYYIGFEILFARTPGKFILGTVVVNENGRKPTVGQVVGRTLARIIPFEPLSCIGSQSRGWHDSLANTFVVRIN